MQVSKRTGATALAFVTALIVFLIYIAWPSYNYQPDSIQAAMALQQVVTGSQFYHPAGGRAYEPGVIESADPDPAQIINTRYFLDYPTSVFAYRLMTLTGWSGLVITPILASRALMGAIGVFFFTLAMYELTESRVFGILAGLGLGLSAGYWSFSTDIYQSITMVAFVSLATYILIRQSKSGGSGLRLSAKFVLALVLAIATLYNVTAVLTAGAFTIAIALIHTRGQLVERLKHMIIFGLIYSAQVAVIYLVVALFFSSNWTGQLNPFTWTDSSSGTSLQVVQMEPVMDVFRTVIGFAKSEVAFPGLSIRDFRSFRNYWDMSGELQKAAVLGYYGVVLLIASVPILILIWKRKQVPENQRWLLIVLPLWFVFYEIFNWVWFPSLSYVWVVPVLIWWVAVALAISLLRIALPRLHRPAMAAAGLFVLLTFSISLLTQFMPESNPERVPWFDIAETLGESSTSDVFVTSNHPLNFYIAYFSHRDVLSVDLIDSANDYDTAKTQSIVDDRIARHRADGGDVFVYVPSEDLLPRVAQAVGLDSVDELEVAWQFPDLTVYKADYPNTSNGS